MKKNIMTIIIAAFSFIITISVISPTAYEEQQQDQTTSLNKIQATQNKTYYQVMNHYNLNWI
jgi:uncharacterized alpha/beta hydrolase family protein